MATYSNFYTVSVPSIGGTYSLPSDESWDLYVLTSNTGAAITVTGVIDVVPTGTLIEGLVYEIIYDGKLLGNNTFTIFGEAVPNNIKNKNLKIKCIYIAGSWVVTFTVNNNSNESLRIPVLMFKCSITQNNTAVPNLNNIVKNDYGITGTARIGVGDYRLNAPAGSFNPINTVVFVSNAGFSGVVQGNIIDDETIAIGTIDMAGNPADNILNGFISIETYA